jgi:hypothetical protein
MVRVSTLLGYVQPLVRFAMTVLAERDAVLDGGDLDIFEEAHRKGVFLNCIVYIAGEGGTFTVNYERQGLDVMRMQISAARIAAALAGIVVTLEHERAPIVVNPLPHDSVDIRQPAPIGVVGTASLREVAGPTQLRAATAFFSRRLGRNFRPSSRGCRDP